MRLYFLRHADALEGANDASRPLSPKGKKQSRAVGRFLKQAQTRFDAAYTSPLLRARQTAEIVLDTSACAASAKLVVADALLNETSAFEFTRWLKSLPEANHILLVGHAPTLAERLSKLLRLPDAESVRLPKGGLACVETEDRREVALKFFVSPKLLGV
jgi:phosphohistidine phosphatase